VVGYGVRNSGSSHWIVQHTTKVLLISTESNVWRGRTRRSADVARPARAERKEDCGNGVEVLVDHRLNRSLPYRHDGCELELTPNGLNRDNASVHAPANRAPGRSCPRTQDVW
jgi:hypothetical protein